MEANTNIYNLTNNKKSVVLNQGGEVNKVMKYLGGDSIVYKHIYVQNENPLDYYGHIYENGRTLYLDSDNITLNGDILTTGCISAPCINMTPSVKIGNNAGLNSTSADGISIGNNSGFTGQKYSGIAIGHYAGYLNQGTFSISIGHNAGITNQQDFAIAIGVESGTQYQEQYGIAIGYAAGSDLQAARAIAIGQGSGNQNQSYRAISIGDSAGSGGQGTCAIALGVEAGRQQQGTNSIAIGYLAGSTIQKENSIAIGYNAGATHQHANSIILNASGSVLNSTAPNAFYVKTLRSTASTSNLYYDNSTGEISYVPSSQRYKHNIIHLTSDTSKIYQLEPREFILNSNQQRSIGFIAEEADTITSEFVTRNSDGQVEGIQWNNIITYLVAEIKKLKNTNDTLVTEIHNLKSQIQNL